MPAPVVCRACPRTEHELHIAASGLPRASAAFGPTPVALAAQAEQDTVPVTFFASLKAQLRGRRGLGKGSGQGGWRLWAAVLALALLCAQIAPAAEAGSGEVYVYREPSGTRLFTDHKMREVGYTFITKFGRPTAYTSSCGGMSKAKLDARLSNYADLIGHYAGAHGVEPALVKAVMRVESCFDHRAVSRVGAQGLMQLMPGTAADLGVTDSFDPAQNISGGVRYLSQMLARFNNDLKLALAAYNAGPGAVQRFGGIPPFPETQSYVERVRSHYERYRG